MVAGGLDPVQAGLAESLARPGGNVTGFTTQVIDVTGKMLETPAAIAHGLGRVAIISPRGTGTPFRAAEAKAGQALGLQLGYIELEGPGPEAIDAGMRRAAGEAQAAVLRGTPFFSLAQRKLIVERAAAHRIPTIYETGEFVELGGLVSYGTDFADLFQKAAAYIAGFTVEENRPSCRSSRRRNSSWRSTSGPHGRSASPFLRRCSRSPTR